jgi:hypothetical protein
MLLLPLDFGLSLWRVHTMAVQVERPREFMAKGLDFALGLWRLHNYARPKAPILMFYWLTISTHFFGLSTKFGHYSHGLSTWTAIPV